MLPQIWRQRGTLAGPTFDDLFNNFFYGWPTYASEEEYTWTPRVDVHETEKDVYLEVELPGLEKENIKVELKNDTLTISGERTYEHKKEEGDSSCVERRYGKFERSFTLPDTVQADKIAAEYTNGILKITLPKSEKAKPKEITVNVK